jgi:hypothetical protein
MDVLLMALTGDLVAYGALPFARDNVIMFAMFVGLVALFGGILVFGGLIWAIERAEVEDGDVPMFPASLAQGLQEVCDDPALDCDTCHGLRVCGGHL